MSFGETESAGGGSRSSTVAYTYMKLNGQCELVAVVRVGCSYPAVFVRPSRLGSEDGDIARGEVLPGEGLADGGVGAHFLFNGFFGDV